MTPSAKTVRVVVTGRVQGVGYRAWVERTATELGLSGWVRNRRDSAVEAVFQGAPDAVDEMVDRCREGPALARVANVQANHDAESGALHGFEVRSTA